MPAPTRLLIVLLLALATLAPVRTVAAQQTGAEAAESLGPNLGEAVHLVGADGAEIGIITVLELVDPYTDFSPDVPPEPGHHFAFAHVTYDNTSNRPQDNVLVLKAVDRNGFVYESDPVAATNAVPEFYVYQLPPHERTSGAVLFQIRDGAEIVQILCDAQNDPNSLTGLSNVPLVDLRQERPRFGDTVSVTDQNGAQVATVSTSEPIDPYLAVEEDSFAEPGGRVVGLAVTVANVGAEPLDITFNHFGLIGTDRVLHLTALFLQRPAEAVAAEPDFPASSKPLAPGQSFSGYIFFRVPEGVTIASIVYVPFGDRLIYLADTGAPAFGSPPPATPAAASSAPATTESRVTPGASVDAGPNVGSRIRIEDFDRNEIAAVSVTKLEDPAPFGDPEPGFREISIDVAFENVGTGQYSVDLSGLSAIDINGTVHDFETEGFGLERLDDPTADSTMSGVAAPGEALGTTLSLQLPEDTALAQIVYGTSDWRYTLVDLRPSRPAYGDAVPIFDTGGAQLATVVVSAPTDPYVPPPSDVEFVLTEERYVTFPTTIENTGQSPFVFHNRDFYVLDTHGYRTREMPRGGVEDDPTGPFLQPNDALPPGDTAAGLIKFVLRDDADPVAVLYLPDDESDTDRSFTIAESGLGIAAPTSPPTFTPQAEVVTPGCEGVIDWGVDFYARLDAATSPLEELPDISEDADVSSIDPEPLRRAVADLRGAAADQAAANPPAVAADANAVAVTFLELFADALESIAEAVETGDQAELDAALAELDGAGDAFIDDELTPAFEALGSACPELNEVG